MEAQQKPTSVNKSTVNKKAAKADKATKVEKAAKTEKTAKVEKTTETAKVPKEKVAKAAKVPKAKVAKVPKEKVAKADAKKTAKTVENTDETKTNEKTNEKASKKKKTRYFETYISKVLKSISADNGITANAKQQLNSAVCIVARTLSAIVSHLTYVSHKKTMSDKEVANATKLLFSGTLSTTATSQAAKSVEKFTTEDSKHSSRQEKAGIMFPPSVAEKFLRNFGFSKVMVTRSAPVYFAAVLEYLVVDILELATRLAKDNSRVRVTIRDLELSVRTDKELSRLFEKCNISFIGGGVVPKIHESLLTKKPRRKRKGAVAATENETDKKGHRFRPGTVSLREIRKFQKTSNCLTFAKFPFERFVRSIVNTYQKGMKISKEVFIVLQYYIEQFVVDFLRDANAAAIHSGRVKLMPADISFMCKLRKYEDLDTSSYEAKTEGDAKTEGEVVAEETKDETKEEVKEVTKKTKAKKARAEVVAPAQEPAPVPEPVQAPAPVSKAVITEVSEVSEVSEESEEELLDE